MVPESHIHTTHSTILLNTHSTILVGAGQRDGRYCEDWSVCVLLSLTLLTKGGGPSVISITIMQLAVSSISIMQY